MKHEKSKEVELERAKLTVWLQLSNLYVTSLEAVPSSLRYPSLIKTEKSMVSTWASGFPH